MKISKQSQLILEAFKKGYTVKEDGSVTGVKYNTITLSTTARGYLSFNIKFEGKVTRVLVHRLQAYQKYGDEVFKDLIVTRHLDGNPLNNSIENILLGTQSENMLDVPKKVRVDKALHAASFIIKHNKEKIKAFHEKEKSYRKTMTEFGISSKGTLNYILNN